MSGYIHGANYILQSIKPLTDVADRETLPLATGELSQQPRANATPNAAQAAMRGRLLALLGIYALVTAGIVAGVLMLLRAEFTASGAGWWRIVWVVVVGWVLVLATLSAIAAWFAHEWKARRDVEGGYRMLFDVTPSPMVVIDRDTRDFLAVNDCAVEQYGWSREEALRMTSDDIYLPEDLAAMAALRRRGIGGNARASIPGIRHRRRDGSIIDVELKVRPIDMDGRPALLVLAEDVTERLRAETMRLATEAQLRQAQKMESVGQLTGGIAHDFNNILTVILANADALQDEESLDAGVTLRLEEIAQAVQRAAGLTHQLLAFSRKQPLRPQQTDVNELVVVTGNLLRRSLGAQIEIDSVLADDLCGINIDRAQLETALVNLCINARDAMPKGGHILIETCNTTLDKDFVSRCPGTVAGDYVTITITDNGSGMSSDVLARVFEPFFSTKEVGEGTGLGLSMVYGFVKQSQGHITIESEVGHGTSIKCSFPRSDGVAKEAVGRDNLPMIGGAERILVTEDDSQVRASVVQQLKSMGYSVAHAPDGTAAIGALETAAEPFHLLLTDVVMPGGLNGKALADEVARRWPRTKILFMSGYNETTISQNGRLMPGVVLLTKPFRKADLAKCVRHVLDRKSAERSELAT